MNFCQACVVRNHSICADLHDDEIVLLNAMGRRRQVRRGEQLLWQGEEAVLVANVVEGVLKLTNGTEDGRQQIVGIVYPSDFIGRPFGATTPYGVTALTDADVCVFSQSDFDAFARDHPRLEHRLLQRMLAELDRSRSWMLLLGRKTAEERLAFFLLEISERLEAPQSAGDVKSLDSFELPLVRRQIADVLGLTIETVSRQFTKLKNDGLINIVSRRQVAILDRDGLQRRAG